MKNRTGGFTLIELLVVVLIVGILAAVAVPQYQKAVEKSRQAEAWAMIKSLNQAAQVAILEGRLGTSGSWEELRGKLAVEVNNDGITKNWFYTYGNHMEGESDVALKSYGAVRYSGPYAYGYALTIDSDGQKYCCTQTVATCAKVGLEVTSLTSDLYGPGSSPCFPIK